MLALISAGRNWANVQSWFEKRDPRDWPCCHLRSGSSATALVSAVFYGVKNGSDTSSDAQRHERASFLLTDVDEFGINHIVLAAILLAMIAAVPGRRLGDQRVEPPCCRYAALSCLSRSSRQFDAQGLASRRAASIWRPQTMHLP